MDIDFMDEDEYLQEIDNLYLSWKKDNEGHILFADYLEHKGYSSEYDEGIEEDDTFFD